MILDSIKSLGKTGTPEFDQQTKVASLLSAAQGMGLAKQSPEDVVSALQRAGWDQNEAVMHLM